jgi:hypothetical protein
MKAFCLRFAKAIYDPAERYEQLPNKFLDK